MPVSLPHRYPFRFIDRVESGTGDQPRLRVRLSAGGRMVPPDRPWPFGLALEVMAQGAMLALPQKASGELRGVLAGVEAATLHHPLWPGDTLEARAELLARYGPTLKTACTLVRLEPRVGIEDGAGEQLVAEARMLLKLDP